MTRFLRLTASPSYSRHSDLPARNVSSTRALAAIGALLCALLAAGNAAADTPAAASYAGGNGTPGDPFQISNLAQLRKFMESSPIFPSSANYKVTANIDAADTSTWLSGAGWQPVDAALLDSFDGGNFEIQNLTINRPTEDNVGFFKSTGSLCCQEINNVNLVGGQVTGRDNVGGLIGSTGNFTTITNSRSTATINGRTGVGGLGGQLGAMSITGSWAGGVVTGTGDMVGGFAGAALGTTISSSHAMGHVVGHRQVGGLAGVFVQGSGQGLTTSWASGKVDGDDHVGGLVGEASGQVTFSFATGAVAATGNNPILAGYALVGGLIGIQDAHGTQDSWASGAVSGPLTGVGGLIGSNAGSVLRCTTVAGQVVTGGANAGSVGGLVGDNKGAITSSRSASTVNATGAVQSIGGLVGLHTGGFNISSSYATGSVTAANATNVGGLVGWHSTGQIQTSHAHGAVQGSQNVGGLIGLSGAPPVVNSHATGAVSGVTNVGGLIGNKAGGLVDTDFATGTVNASGDFAGGLIGRSSGVVQKTYARTGTVTGLQRSGGLVGYSEGTVASSFAINNVTGTTYVGGLIGQSADGVSFGIKDCYAHGSVTGGDKIGGLVGRNEGTSNIAHCYASGTIVLNGAGAAGAFVGDNQRMNNYENYWNETTGGGTAVGTGFAAGATGLTAAQMKQQASFFGFVFPSPWLIDEGVTEPFLDWAAVAVGPTTTGLTSSSNPSLPGQSVTFTATITGNSPTGTVLFQDGATPLSGCIAVTVAAGQAQCTSASLALGGHAISAAYSGDALNTGSTSTTLNQQVIVGSLDIDGSNTQTKYDALTDGLLVIRYLFGLTGNSLVAGALGPTASRIAPAEVKTYLDSINGLLDVDGNGTSDALTDGLLIIRYLFGLSGNALISGAVDLQNGTRKTAPEIQVYIQGLMPQ